MTKKAMKYCLGEWIPKDTNEEANFLNSVGVERLTGAPGRTNSGAIGEWAVGKIVAQQGFTYYRQKCVRATNGSLLRPDGYIPELNMYVEVKTRAYYSKGSWSEKLDHVPRKYSQICSNGKTCIVVLSANQMFERCGHSLCSNKSDEYTKEFVSLAKKYGVVKWIPISKLASFLSHKCGYKTRRVNVSHKRGDKTRRVTRSMTMNLRRSTRLQQLVSAKKLRI